jgi:hypothetical protein
MCAAANKNIQTLYTCVAKEVVPSLKSNVLTASSVLVVILLNIMFLPIVQFWLLLAFFRPKVYSRPNNLNVKTTWYTRICTNICSGIAPLKADPWVYLN